jgi:hypothetical protein
VRLFEEANILARHDFGDGRSRYEEMPSAHHDHLIDLQSGRVVEFRNEEIEALQKIIADQLGYELVGHLRKLWRDCYFWSFPYYLVGSAIAGLVTVSSRAIGWHGSLLVLPLMYLVYTFYRLYLERVAPEPDYFAAKSA